MRMLSLFALLPEEEPLFFNRDSRSTILFSSVSTVSFSFSTTSDMLTPEP